MLFNSPQFLIFFPLVTLLFFIFPIDKKWLLLLAASSIFYLVFIPQYILILFFLIMVDFISGLTLEKIQGKRRVLFLIISIISNIGILAVFKYFNFFSQNLNLLSIFFHTSINFPYSNLVLPLGLSFHVFQSLSYTIEVFRKRYPAEKNLGIYALYVMFYPQLVAGPIERPYNLLPQLHHFQNFDEIRVSSGLKLMLWGFFKKMVIADRIALLINPVYSNPQNFSGITLLVTTFLFSFQIYCDFSGYTDIALGAAKVMGINLMENFNRPYFSSSISEFWTRWHISLSSWFRDYVYIPLGGNRVSKSKWIRNILLVFLLSGLWHGADWKFVIWGLLHGITIIVTNLTANVRTFLIKFLKINITFYRYISILATFNLVSLFWIFFRANNTPEAILIINRILQELINILKFKSIDYSYFLINHLTEFMIIISLILFMETVHFLQKHQQMKDIFANQSIVFRWAFYYLLVLSIIFLGVFEKIKFIYFQF